MTTKYDNMTVVELREAAKNFGLKNISGLKKKELLELLNKVEEKIANTKHTTKQETKYEVRHEEKHEERHEDRHDVSKKEDFSKKIWNS